MQPLEFRVLKTIEDADLIAAQATLLVGVSGGPDSVALLCLLDTLLPQCTLVGVYVDHHLRPNETAAEKQFVRKLCKARGIECRTASVNVLQEIKHSGGSPEECARRLRYQVLEKIRLACNAELIAVGHTSDDNIEGILIRLIRGSGLKGLCGMEMTNGRIIRPLLTISKQDILHYLNAANISYCVDSSNSSRAFLRNRIRLDLLPFLEQEFNPAIRNTIRNTAAILKEEESYLEAETIRVYPAIVSSCKFGENSIDKNALTITTDLLMQHHPAIRRRLIEKICWEMGCRPTFSAIEDIIFCAHRSRTGAELHLSGGLRVIKTAATLIFSSREGRRKPRQRAAEQFGDAVPIDAEGLYPVRSLNRNISVTVSHAYAVNCGSKLVVDADRVPFPLLLRAPLPGESFRPLGAPGRKKISRLLSDKKIPKHVRHHYPVLESRGLIVAVVGMTINNEFGISKDTVRYMSIAWV